MKAKNRKTGEVVDIISYSQLSAAERCPGQDYVNNHPNWHKADKELPPPSIKVLVTDGNSIEYGWYDYYRNEWRSLITKVTHWMYLPELPK